MPSELGATWKEGAHPESESRNEQPWNWLAMSRNLPAYCCLTNSPRNAITQEASLTHSDQHSNDCDGNGTSA